MWECKKPTSSVFGELDRHNVKINSSGELECKEDNKALIWEDNQWACGDAGSNITTEDGLSINSNDQLSIDSPTCSSAEKLIWDGNNFQCNEDINEDEQTLSLTDNVLSILNGNDIDLSNIDLDHDQLSDLDEDDHEQYALLDGRSGGQTLIGGTDTNDPLILQSNTNSTGRLKIHENGITAISSSGSYPGYITNPSSLYLAGDFWGGGDFTIGTQKTVKWAGSTAYISGRSDGISNGLDYLRFYTGSTGAGLRMDINDSGDIGIGRSSQTARTHIKASTSDSSAYALKIDDSSDSNLLSVRNDGRLSGEQIETNKSGSVYLGNTNGINTDDGTSNRNIGIGEGSLNSVTTGYNNTAIGWKVMQNMTTGEDGGENIGIGREVLSSGTSIESCIGIGKWALKNNIAGDHNTAIGYSALESAMVEGAIENTAIGTLAMQNNISGSYNIAMGRETLRNLTSGDSNSAYGSASLLNLINGNWNSAFGYYSLSSLTGGNDNNSIGNSTAFNIVNGSNNNFIGSYTGYYLTGGSNNTMAGHSSGVYYGSGTDQLTTSNDSLFLGYTARAGANNSSKNLSKISYAKIKE